MTMPRKPVSIDKRAWVFVHLVADDTGSMYRPLALALISARVKERIAKNRRGASQLAKVEKAFK